MPSIPYYLAFNPTYSIKDILNGTTDSSRNDPVAALNSADNGTGDSLNLSPQAQSILNVLIGGYEADGEEDGTGFILSLPQQKKISAIIARYKDAPFNEETFRQIEADLKSAGLSPQQLALEQQMRSYNSAQILLDEINGKDSSDYCRKSAAEVTESAAPQKDIDAYILHIFQTWQAISSTAPKPENSATGG